MYGTNVLWLARYNQDYALGPHAHDFFQLFCPRSGSGIARVGDESYPFHTNDTAFLVPPHTLHAFSSARESVGGEEKYKTFKAFDCKFTVENAELRDNLSAIGPSITLNNPFLFHSVCENILGESLDRPPMFQAMVNAGMVSLLIYLLRQATPAKSLPIPSPYSPVKQSFTPQNHGGDINMANIMGYIESNYHEALSLDDIAGAGNTNKTTMTALFKRLYNITPMRYVNLLRLTKARELLVNTHLSVSEIALRSGFQTIHYFSRVFKEKEGVSPLEYRMQRQETFYLQLDE